jgi:hypothetical protein
LTAKLISRLERLEARVARARESNIVVCVLSATLPDDYVGERHVEVVKGPSGLFRYEERPGPEPRGTKKLDFTPIFISESDMNL